MLQHGLPLRFPFPSDLNTGLGGRKRRKRNTEAGPAVLIVSYIACGLVSNKVVFSCKMEDVYEFLGSWCSDY